MNDFPLSHPSKPHTALRHARIATALAVCLGLIAPSWAKTSPPPLAIPTTSVSPAPAEPTLKDSAQTQWTQAVPTDPALRRGHLSNGLQYYILRQTMPRDTVELRLVVRAGSNYERDNERGISHFLEHMVFNGTRHYPSNSMVDTLEKMGVQFGTDLNAYTGFDETVYILPIPLTQPSHFAQGMKILEEIAFNATFDPAEVAQERGIIMQEWRDSSQSAAARQQQENLKVIANGSIYAERLPMGSTEVIQSATPELLRGFYQRWYRPDLMSVIVVGDIDPVQAQRMIERQFGGYKNPSTRATAPNIQLPNNTEPLVGIFKDPTLTQNSVMLANKNTEEFVPANTLGKYVDTIRSSLVTNMLNQRLQAQLDGATPPFLEAAVQVDFVHSLVRSKQALHWYAIAAPGQEAKTLEALHREGLRVLQHGFTESELARAKREQLSFLNNEYNNYQKATEYVRGVVEQEPLPQVEWERATQRKYVPLITLDEVNRTARAFIRGDNQVALINSNSEKTIITPQEMRMILSQSPQVDAYQETLTRDRLLPELPKGGKVVKTTYDRYADLTTWTLSNGVKASFRSVPNNDGPIVFSGYSDGGFSRLSNAQWKKVKWGMDGLTETGLNGLSKTQVAHVLAGKDVSMQLSLGETTQGVSGKFDVRDSEAAFQMIYSLITGINHNPAAFDAYMSRQKASAANLKENRDVLFEQAVQAALNQGSPRFTGVIPSEQDWQNTDYETIYQTYRDAFANANGMQFVFVGKGKTAQMRDWAERYLGSLPSNTAKTPKMRDTGERLNYSPRTIEVKKGSEAIAQVRLIYGGTARYDADESLAMSAIAHALNIRLIERLREQEGGVYSPNASAAMVKRPYGQYALMISFSCAPDQVDALIQSAQEEVDHIVRDGVRAQDLLKFQQAEQNGYTRATGTNEFWVASVQRAQQYDEPYSSITDYPQRVGELSADSVHAVAKKYLARERVTAVLRPEKP